MCDTVKRCLQPGGVTVKQCLQPGGVTVGVFPSQYENDELSREMRALASAQPAGDSALEAG